MSVKGIVHRVKNSKRKRPLLMHKSEDEIEQFIHDHLRHRNIYYSQAQLVFSGESVDYKQLAEQIKSIVSHKNL